jgi:hypothetical protein
VPIITTFTVDTPEFADCISCALSGPIGKTDGADAADWNGWSMAIDDDEIDGGYRAAATRKSRVEHFADWRRTARERFVAKPRFSRTLSMCG